jgi:hypothetical protein
VTQRLTVLLADDVAASLETMAAIHGVSRAAMIQCCISMQDWIESVLLRGDEIHAVAPDGTFRKMTMNWLPSAFTHED